MHVITRQALKRFWGEYPDSETALRAWFGMTRRAAWKHIAGVREVFPHADAAGMYTVFNICGNKYRLISQIDYQAGKVFIHSVLKHDEYSRGRWKEK